MKALLKTLLFFLAFIGCRAFANTPVNLTCTTEASVPGHTSAHITETCSPAASGVVSSCLKVPVTLTILVSCAITSIAVLHYSGIYDMAVALTLPLLEYIAFDKIAALFFLAGITYWLKSCVLEQIPYGTTILFYFRTGEQLITTSICMIGKGVILLFNGLGFVIEWGIDYIGALITRLGALITRLFVIIFFHNFFTDREML